MRAPSPTPVVSLRRLHFAYPGSAPLFDGLSVELPAGLTQLHGDSGSGKTTLLRLLAGALHGSGELRCELTLLGQRFDDDPAAYRRAVCAFDVRDAAFDALTPVALPAAVRTRYLGLDEAAWQRHLHGFELGPHLGKPLHALSTGSRRKVGLALALSAGCPLTLLDEPGAGLDRESLDHLGQALAQAASWTRRAIVFAGGLAPLPLAAEISLPAL